MEAILHYLFSLSKRLVFLALACSLVPIVLVSLGYPRETAFAVYLTVLACSLPWLLWFQQMYYLGIGRSSKGFVHIRTAFFSSLFCTALIFTLFPFIPSPGNFSIDAIPPRPSLSEDSILSFPEGALILNPSQIFPTAGIPAEVKALWFGGRTLFFTNVSTNEETLSLGGPENLQVPFRKDYPQLNSSLLGRRAASLWLKNMLGFHSALQKLSIGYGASYPLPPNTAFAQILPQSDDAPAPPAAPRLEAYPRLFLAVFGLYAFACLLGILFSLRQHYLGSLCLILVVSLWGSTHIMQWLLKISSLIPIPYAFEAGLGIASLLLIGALCGFGINSFPKFQKAAKK